MTGAVLAPLAVTSQPGQLRLDTILKVLRNTGGFLAPLRSALDAGMRAQQTMVASSKIMYRVEAGVGIVMAVPVGEDSRGKEGDFMGLSL